jgi:hypothetical protein
VERPGVGGFGEAIRDVYSSVAIYPICSSGYATVDERLPAIVSINVEVKTKIPY